MLSQRKPGEMEKKEKFRLVRQLGMGGFGQTFLAEVIDPKLREKWAQFVALKIPFDRTKEQVLISELITNATLHQLLQGIQAPNLVRYYGFDVYDDHYVMAMEFIKGQDLRSVLNAQRILPIEKAIDFTKQVCHGLICMHEHHFFHRDIKPENIMICEDGAVKIMDLGISKILSTSELASTTIGTYLYMAKEMVTGEGGSYYSDIHSLGVTLYEMATGKHPFGGDSIKAVIDKICNEDASPPSELNANIDHRLSHIILKAIKRDISQRYKSAADFLKALENWEKGIDETDQWVEQTIARARELFTITKAHEAEELIKEALVSHPERARLHACLGELYNKCHRYQDAILVFERGMKVAPESSILYWNAAFSYKQLGNNIRAVENLRKAMSCGLESNLEDQAARMIKIWEHR